MADTKYNIGDSYKAEYPNPPVKPELQYKIGQWISIREEGVLVATCEIEKTNETEYEGKITKVFKAKVPVDPRKTGPAKNREVKPL